LNLWAEPLQWVKLLHRHLCSLIVKLEQNKGTGTVDSDHVHQIQTQARAKVLISQQALNRLPALPQFSCTREHARLTLRHHRAELVLDVLDRLEEVAVAPVVSPMNNSLQCSTFCLRESFHPLPEVFWGVWSGSREWVPGLGFQGVVIKQAANRRMDGGGAGTEEATPGEKFARTPLAPPRPTSCIYTLGARQSDTLVQRF
ncbi:hypothetical protein XENOCAPTIV_013993, partial [Xenoophorus captivus]